MVSDIYFDIPPHLTALAIALSAILAMIAVSTMAVLGRSAVVRGMARTRSELLVIAQQELDRLRTPGERTTLSPGSFDVLNDDWPAGTRLQVSVKEADDDLFLLRVEASRRTGEGVRSVSLETAVERGDES